MQIQNKLIILSLSSLTLLGCDSLPNLNDTFSGRKVDYEKQSRSIRALEVPPQMITAESEHLMDIPEMAEQHGHGNTADTSNAHATKVTTRVTQLPLSQQVLPKQDNIKLIKYGNMRYLRIKGSKEQTWSKMREFWLNRGMLIKRETPSTGILETEWAENRADIPQDMVRKTIGVVFDGMYSSGTRDKYRVRVEDSNDAGYSELYITHYGMVEVFEEGTETDRTLWTQRPREPELEAEMLGSMMVFFGVEEKKARAILAQKQKQREDKASIVRNNSGHSLLVVKENFARAWRRTGSALDRINFIVEDRDRSNGIYYVQYADPLAEESKAGWFSSLKFWGSDETKDKAKFQIRLVSKGNQTNISVADEQGIEVVNDTSYRILTLLHEQLK